MEKIRVEMDFLDGANKTLRISLEDPKEDLAQTQIEDAMDSIISHNIFLSNGEDLVSKDGARIITTIINEMEI